MAFPAAFRFRTMSLSILERLRELLAAILRVPSERFRTNAHLMDEIGADSLQFLDYVASVEKEFGIKLTGSQSERFSTLEKGAKFLEQALEELGQINGEASLVEAEVAPASASPVGAGPAPHPSSSEFHLDEGGYLHHSFEVGMPLTGRNNLGETPLLKLIGDLRWKHVALFSGVPSKDLCDDTGERLYATFFYVEATFSEDEPLASFGENDRLRIVSSLRSFGGSILDGYHRLARASDDVSEGCAFSRIPPSPPYFRTSNIFVKMLEGAQWLKKSKPCQEGMNEIPAADGSPDSADLCRAADADDSFEPLPEGWTLLSGGPLEGFYDIVPDRDLNGAGLLYFANYVQILDIVERGFLELSLPFPFPSEFVDRRTTVRRQSAYLSNASQTDRIRVTATIAARDPFRNPRISAASPQDQPIDLWLNFVMRRCSDERKMMVSTVRKLITDATWGETGLLDDLFR